MAKQYTEWWTKVCLSIDERKNNKKQVGKKMGWKRVFQSYINTKLHHRIPGEDESDVQNLRDIADMYRHTIHAGLWSRSYGGKVLTRKI